MNLNYCIIKDGQIFTLVNPEEAGKPFFTASVCSLCELDDECSAFSGNLCAIHEAEIDEYYIKVGIVVKDLNPDHSVMMRIEV